MDVAQAEPGLIDIGEVSSVAGKGMAPLRWQNCGKSRQPAAQPLNVACDLLRSKSSEWLQAQWAQRTAPRRHPRQDPRKESVHHRCESARQADGDCAPSTPFGGRVAAVDDRSRARGTGCQGGRSIEEGNQIGLGSCRVSGPAGARMRPRASRLAFRRRPLGGPRGEGSNHRQIAANHRFRDRLTGRFCTSLSEAPSSVA